MPPSVQCQLGRQKPLVLPSKCWNVIDVTFTQTTTLPASRKCTRSSWKPHVLLLNLARDRKKYHRGIPDFHILDYQFKCFHFLLQEQMQHFDWLNLTYHCPELLRKRVRRGALLLPHASIANSVFQSNAIHFSKYIHPHVYIQYQNSPPP